MKNTMFLGIFLSTFLGLSSSLQSYPILAVFGDPYSERDEKDRIERERIERICREEKQRLEKVRDEARQREKERLEREKKESK